MMKKALVALAVVGLILAVAVPAWADPTDYDKKADKGIYYLVSKDANWNPLPRSTSAFGMGKFSIKNGTLTMHLVVHKLTPGDWYYVELVEKDSDCLGWNPVGDDRYSRFYGQADAYGNVNMTFSWQIGSPTNLEVNMKNADWVALLDPSAYGVPSEWIYTGQGWDYVLYGATTVPNHCQ